VPAATKHDAVLTELPTARKALAVLRSAGHSDLATSVQHILDYAKERAEQGVSKRMTDTALDRTRTLRVTPEFRDHVYAGAAEDGTTVAEIIVQNLQEFVSGEWAPPAPRRAPRGSNLTKVAISVRIPEELWAAASALGKDPQAIAQRGYRLTAESVAVTALYERFGEPEASTTA
jgi:hypothetical protein